MRLMNFSGLALVAAASAPFAATSVGSAWVVYTKEQWLRGAGLLGAELKPAVVARGRALIAQLDAPRPGPDAPSKRGLKIVLVAPGNDPVETLDAGASPVRTSPKE